MPQPPKSILFPYTTLFRSVLGQQVSDGVTGLVWQNAGPVRSWSDFGVSQNPQNVTTAAMTVDTNGNLQTVAQMGKTGQAAPPWSTPNGAYTNDGTVVWLNSGPFAQPGTAPVRYGYVGRNPSNK